MDSDVPLNIDDALTDAVMPAIRISELVTDLMAGVYTDDQVKRLRDACADRLRYSADMEAAALEVGDEERSTDKVKPLYLRRRLGMVVGHEVKKGRRYTVVVWADNEHHWDNRGRDRLRARWTMSPGSLVKVVA